MVCNCCGKIRPAAEVVGVLAVEDMYDKLRSYPTQHTPVAIERCNVHYCIICYDEKVLRKITADKGKQREQWDNQHSEYAYMLRRNCVLNPKYYME